MVVQAAGRVVRDALERPQRWERQEVQTLLGLYVCVCVGGEGVTGRTTCFRRPAGSIKVLTAYPRGLCVQDQAERVQ